MAQSGGRGLLPYVEGSTALRWLGCTNGCYGGGLELAADCTKDRSSSQEASGQICLSISSAACTHLFPGTHAGCQVLRPVNVAHFCSFSRSALDLRRPTTGTSGLCVSVSSCLAHKVCSTTAADEAVAAGSLIRSRTAIRSRVPKTCVGHSAASDGGHLASRADQRCWPSAEASSSLDQAPPVFVRDGS